MPVYGNGEKKTPLWASILLFLFIVVGAVALTILMASEADGFRRRHHGEEEVEENFKPI